MKKRSHKSQVALVQAAIEAREAREVVTVDCHYAGNMGKSVLDFLFSTISKGIEVVDSRSYYDRGYLGYNGWYKISLTKRDFVKISTNRDGSRYDYRDEYLRSKRLCFISVQ